MFIYLLDLIFSTSSVGILALLQILQLVVRNMLEPANILKKRFHSLVVDQNCLVTAWSKLLLAFLDLGNYLGPVLPVAMFTHMSVPTSLGIEWGLGPKLWVH